MDDAWRYKRGLSNRVSTDQIDQIYQTALDAGAVGGKLLGAGGGGFMLIFACPSKHDEIREKLNGLIHVPFDFDTMGSQVIYYQDSVAK